MANGSLEHETRTRQSHSKNLGMLGNATSYSRVHGSVLQSKSFSLTFTSSQWRLFRWLLTVGCMLADELLDNVSVPTLRAKSQTALLWNRLSDVLAMQFINDAINCSGREAFETTR